MENNNATTTLGGPDLGPQTNANNLATTNNAFGGDAPMSVGPPSNNFNATNNNNNNNNNFNALSNNNNTNNFNTPNNNFNAPLNFGNNSGAPKGISFNPALAGKQLEKSGVLVSQAKPHKPVPRLAFWLAVALAAIFLVGLVVVIAYFLTAKPSCASCVITGVPPAGPDGNNWVACNKDQCQGTAAITGTGTYCAVFGTNVPLGVDTNISGDIIRAALTASTGTDPGPDDTWTEFASQCVNNKCVGFSLDNVSNIVYPCLPNPNGSSVATNASGGKVPTDTTADHLWTIVTR